MRHARRPLIALIELYQRFVSPLKWRAALAVEFP